MTRLASIGAGVFLLVTAGTVQAADSWAPSSAPVIYDWTGVYLGLHGGYGVGSLDWDADLVGVPPNPDDTGSFDVSGFFAGAQVGANVQLDNFVIGAEVDIAAVAISGQGEPVALGDSTPMGTIDWLGTARLRAGVAFDALFIYATGGWAMGGGTVTFTDVELADDDRTRQAQFTGWTIGLGGEVAVAENISFKGEYLFTSLVTGDIDFGVVAATPMSVAASIGLHTVKAGFNFAF